MGGAARRGLRRMRCSRCRRRMLRCRARAVRRFDGLSGASIADASAAGFQSQRQEKRRLLCPEPLRAGNDANERQERNQTLFFHTSSFHSVFFFQIVSFGAGFVQAAHASKNSIPAAKTTD